MPINPAKGGRMETAMNHSRRLSHLLQITPTMMKITTDRTDLGIPIKMVSRLALIKISALVCVPSFLASYIPSHCLATNQVRRSE